MATIYKAAAKNTLINKIFTVTINRLDINGCGVATLQNKSLFVEQTLPGEQVEVKITEQNSKYLKAKLLSLQLPSGQRTSPVCKHFSVCGGCDLQHLQETEQLAFKQEKISQLFMRQNIANALPWQPAITASPYAYRRKARIGVQYNKKGQATIGFRQKASNQLAAIKACPVLVAPIQGIFKPLNTLVNALTGYKSVGHIEVIVTDHISLVVRQLVPLNTDDQELWRKVSTEPQWQIYFDYGDRYEALTKVDKLSYLLPDNSQISFQASDFIQVNHEINSAMVAQAVTWLDLSKTDQVLDLFCGLGNFSLPIAKQAGFVCGVEGVQDMVDRAMQNALANNIDNCQFYQGDLNSAWENALWLKNHSFNKVLLDPARAGAEIAIAEVVKLTPECIVYVSCDPSTLARDAKVALAQGYNIEKIVMLEMFSQTKHVETMVLFRHS